MVVANTCLLPARRACCPRDFTWSTGFGTSCDDAETRRCFKIIEYVMASASKCHNTFEAVVAGDMKFLGARYGV